MLNQGAHLLGEKDFLGNVFLILPLLSAQILEKFHIGQNLLDDVKEWNVNFDLLEDLHHVFYFISLFFEVGGCHEMLWEWDPRLIW
jgi:hypothetical protein